MKSSQIFYFENHDSLRENKEMQISISDKYSTFLQKA